MSPKKTYTPAVEAKPELPPIAPTVLVESPPASAPTQLDRIEAMLERACRRLQC